MEAWHSLLALLDDDRRQVGLGVDQVHRRRGQHVGHERGAGAGLVEDEAVGLEPCAPRGVLCVCVVSGGEGGGA
jgi:hypothetical protein